VITIFIIRV